MPAHNPLGKARRLKHEIIDNYLMENQNPPGAVALQAGSAYSRYRQFALSLLSFVLLVVAGAVIYQVLQEMSYQRLVEEFSKLSTPQLLLAAIFTAGSYVVLSGYDWSALRYLGYNLPYRIIALASICGTAIANTVGLNLVSGAAVRYRVYAAAGLNATVVGQITAFGVTAFGLCVTVIAAAGWAVYPELFAEYFHLPPVTLRGFGILLLAVFSLLGIAITLKRGPVRIGSWRFQVPSTPILVAQMVFSIVDMVLAGGCLNILLPSSPVPFLSFLSIYVVAVAAGMISHVPGGFGVFESIILLTLRHSIPPESIAAGLLVYRAIYHLVPLVLATLVLAAHTAFERPD
jgi:phosphatidylglycerol lysyltransferase